MSESEKNISVKVIFQIYNLYFFRHILVIIYKVKEKMFRTYVRTFFYHFVINFLSASLIFPNTQSTKSVIENIAIGKYGIIIKIMEGKRDPD